MDCGIRNTCRHELTIATSPTVPRPDPSADGRGDRSRPGEPVPDRAGPTAPAQAHPGSPVPRTEGRPGTDRASTSGTETLPGPGTVISPRSGYCLSLASVVVATGWSDQEAVDLLILWRRKHGEDLKLDRLDWHQRTIWRAHATREAGESRQQYQEALSRLATAHEEQVAGTAFKKAMLDAGMPPPSRAGSSGFWPGCWGMGSRRVGEKRWRTSWAFPRGRRRSGCTTR